MTDKDIRKNFIEQNEGGRISGQDHDSDPEEMKGRRNKKRRPPLQNTQRFLAHLLVLIIIIWLMFGLVFGAFTARTNDMYPRIDQGDLVLFYRMDQDFKAQDVIVVKKDGKRYLGRIVAAGGDTVEINSESRLVINGHQILESNIFYSTPRYDTDITYPLTVPEGSYFVLADNREGGTDSRYYGTVSKEEIIGTVFNVMRRNNL